jgi:hypothetical protein
MRLNKLLLALLLAGFPAMATAMSLGEGQILSHVGEPLTANIALLGAYNKDIKFTQVRNTECRSSVISSSTNGCDALYEGNLTFSLKQRPDGQYFLRVKGDKGDEFFYHILIKTVSGAGEVVFNSFEFLPEFKTNQDAPPVMTDGADVLPATGKFGVVAGKVIEVMAEDEKAPIAKHVPESASPPAVKKEVTVKTKPVAPTAEVKANNAVDSRLQIKKNGDYSDDIHALQKENGEIEEQIVLLEKHIKLLKEVIRLKSQIDAPVAAASSVAAVKSPQHTPVPAPVRSNLPQAGDTPAIVTWVLLAVVVILAGLLFVMYRKMKMLNLSPGKLKPELKPPASLNVKKSLDLTGAFIKPKW